MNRVDNRVILAAQIRSEGARMRDTFKRYSLAWVTGTIFLVLLTAQWLSGWNEYVSLQHEHGAQVRLLTYVFQMIRSTLENWQGEFFSLLYQVVVLTYLYYAGSPIGGGSDQRLEQKVDAILRKVHPDEADKMIEEIDRIYPR
jgi:hypothetical protein